MNIFKKNTTQTEPEAIQKVMNALEAKRGSIIRWFCRFLIAFNLVWWSFILGIAFLITLD